MTCILNMLEQSFDLWKNMSKSQKEIRIEDFIDNSNIPEDKLFKKIWLKNKLIKIINQEFFLSDNIISYYNLGKIKVSLEMRLMKCYILDLFQKTKKEDYELAYIILFFKDLILKKQNIFEIIQTLYPIQLNSINNYIIQFKILFGIICLLVGKYYDDDAMINIDYVIILKQLIPQRNFMNLKLINKYESNILKINNFHMKNNAEEFIVLINSIIYDN